MNIFISNLPFSISEDEIMRLFKPFGEVERINLRTKSGNNARAFGLIVMPDEAAGYKAIDALNGKNIDGRPISVSVERQKAVKPKVIANKVKELDPINKPHIPMIDPKAQIIPEVVEKKAKVIAKPKTNSRGVKPWEKRKGRGVGKPWKKKAGGIKKKFRHSK